MDKNKENKNKENKNKQNKNTSTAYSINDAVNSALKLPGVKVDRASFLKAQFKSYKKEQLNAILEVGPVVYGCSRKELKEKAIKIVRERTAVSTGASFAAGVPGGLALAATIPADILQYFGVSLRMAQELAYLYGEEDLWLDDYSENRSARDRLLIYIGVMLGTSGAASILRITSTGIAKSIVKRIPEAALTKGVIMPVLNKVAETFGLAVSKQMLAKGISKVIPIVGGLVSGGITFATMLPMGNKLADTLDEACFGAAEEEIAADWKIVEDMCRTDADKEAEADTTDEATDKETEAEAAGESADKDTGAAGSGSQPAESDTSRASVEESGTEGM